MKALIAAAMLAVMPAASFAALPADTDPITKEEVAGRAMICLKLRSGELKGSEVSAALKLDTPRKNRDFALQCYMFMLGAEVGAKSVSP